MRLAVSQSGTEGKARCPFDVLSSQKGRKDPSPDVEIVAENFFLKVFGHKTQIIGVQ